MASAEVGEAGDHPMQVVQVVQVVEGELVSKEQGEVAGEVLTGRCSGSALEVGVMMLEMR